MSNTMIGLAGEHHVCAELYRRNILALMTPKNNPIFDIVASDANGKRSVSIQVKTMGVKNKTGWKFGIDMAQRKNNPNLFVVLVDMKRDGKNDYYIYKYDELSKRVNELYEEYIITPKRDGEKRKDPGFRWFDHKFFNESDKKKLNNWKLLGFSKTLF